MAFEDIKVGDKVIVEPHWGTNYVAVVKKVGKASFVACRGTHEITFLKRSGREKGGDSWTPTYARLATEELIEKTEKECRKEKYIRTCQNFDFKSLSYETLEQIYNILTKN